MRHQICFSLECIQKNEDRKPISCFPLASLFLCILTRNCLLEISFYYRLLQTSKGSNGLFSLFVCSPVWKTNGFL